MATNLYGHVIWLTTTEFQEELLPPPPKQLLPSRKSLSRISSLLSDLSRTYKNRALEERRPCADVLAAGFMTTLNDQVLSPASGNTLEVHPLAHSSRSRRKGKSVVMRSGQEPDAPAAARFPSYRMRRLRSRDYVETDIFSTKTPADEHYQIVLTFVEGGNAHDPFEDVAKEDVEPGSETRIAVREHLIANAERVFALQNRTAVFSVIILGDEFRFMRSDRSGVTISQKANYVKDTRVFIEMLLGYLLLDDIRRGVDSTATLLTQDSEDYHLMDRLADPTIPFHIPVLSSLEGKLLPSYVPCVLKKEVSTSCSSHAPPSGMSVDHWILSEKPQPLPIWNTVREPQDDAYVFDYVREGFRQSLDKCALRYKFTIGEDEFLVGRPTSEPVDDLVGRGTKGYVAYHIQSRSFAWVKDAWHVSRIIRKSEGYILEELNKANVPNVPTLLCHGTIGGQETATSECWFRTGMARTGNEERKAAARRVANGNVAGTKHPREAAGGHTHFAHYEHYRIAFKEVLLPFEKLRSTKQLVRVVRDCVDAHAEAVQRCFILHHDVSDGNMLISPIFVQREGDERLSVEWRGVLADWELAISYPEKRIVRGIRVKPSRSGTWSYMSVASLTDPTHFVGIPDELESIFHVLFYKAVQMAPHNIEEHVPAYLAQYFKEENVGVNAVPECGFAKRLLVTRGELNFTNFPRTLSFQTDSGENHAMNSVIDILLKVFQARYAMRQYATELLKYQKEEEQISEDRTGNKFKRDHDDDEPLAQRPIPGLVGSNIPARHPSRDDSLRMVFGIKKPELPRDETINIGKRLEDHRLMRRLLWGATTTWDWPENEVMEDHEA